MKKQQRRPAAAAAFSVNAITNDESYTITLQIPRHVNFPIIGPTSIEFVGIGASAATTTLFVWMITILLFRQKPAKKVSSPKAKEESPPATPSVGGIRSENVTAKTYKKTYGSLEKFMDDARNARSLLRKRCDPDTVEKRQEKRERLRSSPTSPVGPLGLSPSLLKEKRSGLRTRLEEDRLKSIQPSNIEGESITSGSPRSRHGNRK